MLQGRPREFVKRALEVTRAKLVFDRITQTRYTRLYFFISAFSCILLCALQAVILSDNTKAVDILAAAVAEAEPSPHITIVKDDELHICDSIPDRKDSNCVVLWMSNTRGALSVQKRSRSRRSYKSRFLRRQLPAEEEGSSASSDDEGGVSSDDDGEESSDDEEGESSDDEEEEEEDDDDEGVKGSTTTSTTPTATVTTSTSGGVSAITISSTSSPDATSVVVTTTATPTPLPTSTGTPNPNSPLNDISLSLNQQSSNSPHTMRCIYSMSWLETVLHDSQREDGATMFYHIWLFGLSLVAILNESLPHLGAAFAGHILAAGWSSSRIQGAKALAQLYRDVIVAGPCQGADMLGLWWEMRLAHTIPTVVFNILSLLALGFVSYKLLKVYSAASFYKVGPTRPMQRAYKVLLVFSVGLQMTGFFTAVSSGLWLSKVAHGDFRALSRHEALYIAGFVVLLLVELPWLFLGWVCVRKECKKRFWVFMALSAILLTISIVMFTSDAYRTIFKSWSFFAALTVTSFALLVLTVLLGVVCYINYGKGLQAYLEMSEEPEGADFDPVAGYRGGEKYPEQNPFPASAYGYAPAFHEKQDAEWSSPTALPKPPTAAEVSQYLSISRASPPVAVQSIGLSAPSNPFEDPSDRASVVEAEARMRSAWSPNSTDMDARSMRTVMSPNSDVPHGFHLQPPPPSRVVHAAGDRASLTESLEPYAGMPALPITPMVAHGHSREGSVRSITKAPFPVTREPPTRSNSVSSTNSARSLKKSPFPTAPVSTGSLTRSNTSLSRDSGYPTSSYPASSYYQQTTSDLLSVQNARYLTPSPFHDVDVPSSVRGSMVSSVGGDYQVAGMGPKRQTLGVGTPLVQEVPRNLYIANQV